MTAAEIAARFHAKARGKGWVAKCPTHDDSTASLSIDPGETGNVLVRCRAGCDRAMVLAAVGLTQADIRTNGSGPAPKADIIATYDYRDERGAPLYQVCRLSPKSFRQRRPDGAGGWIWNLDGVRRVLYRLPDLAQADTAWIVEGEKDADRLVAEGFIATTWAGGAKGWRADYAQQLKTLSVQRVVIVPDNDEPGRQAGKTILAALMAVGIPAQILELPDLPAKGDVSDWLNADHTAHELQRLADGDSAPVFGVTIADFHAYMPDHSYIFAPTRELWPAASVDARLPKMALTDEDGQPVYSEHGIKKIKASAWLDRHQAVEQMTWSPGDGMLVRDRLVAEGGWIDRPGCACFNLYRPPSLVLGSVDRADTWVAHVETVYPDDAPHIFDWLAHRVQHPEEKINHALVLGGKSGIGKDTILEPVIAAVGPWNVGDISAPLLLGRFNSFLKSVILRVSEARDLGDLDRYAFYERSKLYMAAPPDVLRIDEKNLREYPIRNVCGVVITTNHKTNGLYLPADDRRHYVAWSDLQPEDIADAYFPDLYEWFADGGTRHVAAWLAARDLRAFNPKATPPKTAAFWTIVDAGRAPEDAEAADAIAAHGSPEAVTLAQLAEFPTPDAFKGWLSDRRNARSVPHRLEAAGYTAQRNPGAKDGLWFVSGRRCVIYVNTDLAPPARCAAAQALIYRSDR